MKIEIKHLKKAYTELTPLKETKKGRFFKRKVLGKPPQNGRSPVRFRTEGRNGVLHLFIFAKMRFLKKRGKARKTKKTGENRRFSVLHLFRPEHLGISSLKDMFFNIT